MSDELQGVPRSSEAHPRSSEAHPRSSEALGNRPKLDLGSRMKAPSYGNVAEYDWFPDQVRDDDYREPRLKEGVSKCSKQELDASRRSYRELTDKCQVAVLQAIVS